MTFSAAASESAYPCAAKPEVTVRQEPIARVAMRAYERPSVIGISSQGDFRNSWITSLRRLPRDPRQEQRGALGLNRKRTKVGGLAGRMIVVPLEADGVDGGGDVL